MLPDIGKSTWLANKNNNVRNILEFARIVLHCFVRFFHIMVHTKQMCD